MDWLRRNLPAVLALETQADAEVVEAEVVEVEVVEAEVVEPEVVEAGSLRPMGRSGRMDDPVDATLAAIAQVTSRLSDFRGESLNLSAEFFAKFVTAEEPDGGTRLSDWRWACSTFRCCF